MRIRLLPLALATLCGCQTSYVAHTEVVRGLLQAERYEDAAVKEAAYAKSYGKGDRILMLLNRGATLRDASHYAESNKCLLEAEDLLADFYKRSAGGEVAKSMLSGAAGDFLAEDFERILIYVLTAQNYLALGQRSEALVEVRRLTGKLGVLADVKAHGRRYQGDGFAQWLAGLLYEDAGEANDALISYKAALASFPKGAVSDDVGRSICADAFRAAGIAGIPKSDVEGCDEAPADDASAQPLGQDGEVVVLHAAGLVPARSQVRFNCGFLSGDGPLRCYTEGEHPDVGSLKLVSIAVPVLHPAPMQLQGAQLWVDGQPQGRAELMEDVTRIAMETLQDRMPEYQRQATTRALTRAAASAGVGVGATALAKSGRNNSTRSQQNAQAVGAAVGLLFNAVASETEEADKRSWFTLPAVYGVARARLPAGTHRLQVTLTDPSGAPMRTVDFGQVQVEPGQRVILAVRSVR